MLLIVEDDPMLGDALCEGLGVHFRTHLARNLADARLALETMEFQMMVLDLTLPDGSGLDLLREMRQAHRNLPVIILTARDRTEDRIAGLQLGADDYVGKPFDLNELLARCQAVIRRLHGDLSPVIEIGPLSFDPASRTAKVDGETLALSATELRLLEVLVAARGRLLSKAQIEERLYDWTTEIESNTVEVYISRLRRKIGKDLIRTIRGLGYMIVAES